MNKNDKVKTRKGRKMYKDSEYIRFDWAIKRILRDKANFGVLEGLMTVLINTDIKILEVLESESNRDSAEDKSNRVDVKAKTADGEIVLIEVQLARESHFMQRILFGTSKAIVEQLEIGQGYELIKKVYSINVLYFDLGDGEDYVYHGKTEFRGIHNGELLSLSPFQQQKFNVQAVSDLYPEYFILKVNDFNRWSKVPLEQWIYSLSTGDIPEDADAPGLQEAREALRITRMSKAELDAYYHHLDNMVILKDNISTARYEGREEGREEEKLSIARSLKQMGMTDDDIAKATGLEPERIAAL